MIEYYFNKGFKLTKNKYLEIEITIFPNDNWNLFKINNSLSLKGDHCGFKSEISIYKIFEFIFNIYDKRHFDWENNKFIDQTIKVKNEKSCFYCKTRNLKGYHILNEKNYCDDCIDKNISHIISLKISKK